MELPPLSPLALDGSSRLDGWDVEEDFDNFDIDFEDLFKDAEGIDNCGNQEQEREQQQNQEQQQQQQPAVDGGDGGDIPSIANGNVDLPSLSEANTSGPNTMPSTAGNMSAVIEREDGPHAVAATAGPFNTTATTWSTTSMSEDSDDCSRSSISGNSCTFGAISPTSGPIPPPAISCMTPSDRSISSSSGSTTEAPRSVTSEASTVNNDTANGNHKRLLSVSSGAGTPILPFTFAPAFGGGGGSSSPSSLPNFGGLQAAALAAAASGAAGQALAAGWKRLRGGDDGGPSSSSAVACGLAASAGSVGGGTAPSRLLCGAGDGSSSAGHGGRINKRAKREERLMKNREAANRSRVKRKEVLGELENRVDTLSSSLAASRDETAALAQEIASLREQNSFLRGMLSVQGNTVDLPPIVPSSTATSHGRSCQGAAAAAVGGCSGGGGGGGGGSRRGASAAAAGASAILGAVGMGLAVVSCVALSPAGFGGRSANRGDSSETRLGHGGVGSTHSAYASREGGVGGGGGGGGGYGNNMNTGGRRMLLAVDEGDYNYPGEETSLLGFSGGGVGGYFLVGMAIALALVLVFAVARWTYRKAAAHRRVGGRGSLGRRGGDGALRRERRQGKGAAFGYLGGVWPMDRLLSGDKPIRKHM